MHHVPNHCTPSGVPWIRPPSAAPLAPSISTGTNGVHQPNVQTCFSAQALSHPADQVYNRGMNLCEPKFHKLRAQRVISLATCGNFRNFPEPSSARTHPSIVHSSFFTSFAHQTPPRCPSPLCTYTPRCPLHIHKWPVIS